MPCPGCGVVRACLALAAGHVRVAWALNPFAFAVVPVGIVELAWMVVPRLPRWRYPPWLVIVAAVLLVAFWAGRLATGAHPDGIDLSRGAIGRAWAFIAPA